MSFEPPGVVDEDVDAAVVGDGCGDELLAVVADHGVAGHEMDAVAGAQALADLGDRLLALGDVATVDDHARAVAEERLGDGSSDPTRAARDHSDAP